MKVVVEQVVNQVLKAIVVMLVNLVSMDVMGKLLMNE